MLSALAPIGVPSPPASWNDASLPMAPQFHTEPDTYLDRIRAALPRYDDLQQRSIDAIPFAPAARARARDRHRGDDPPAARALPRRRGHRPRREPRDGLPGARDGHRGAPRADAGPASRRPLGPRDRRAGRPPPRCRPETRPAAPRSRAVAFAGARRPGGRREPEPSTRAGRRLPRRARGSRRVERRRRRLAGRRPRRDPRRLRQEPPRRSRCPRSSTRSATGSPT